LSRIREGAELVDARSDQEGDRELRRELQS
jgi:hypothetical protein